MSFRIAKRLCVVAILSLSAGDTHSGHGGAGGGGFAWQWPIPEHQKTTVQAYIQAQSQARTLPPPMSFNAQGRAYPDISAVAVEGTSQSSPTVAGLFSMVTDHRLNAGLPPLGFFAPRLWQAMEKHPGVAVSKSSDFIHRCSPPRNHRAMTRHFVSAPLYLIALAGPVLLAVCVRSVIPNSLANLLQIFDRMCSSRTSQSAIQTRAARMVSMRRRAGIRQPVGAGLSGQACCNCLAQMTTCDWVGVGGVRSER